MSPRYQRRDARTNLEAKRKERDEKRAGDREKRKNEKPQRKAKDGKVVFMISALAFGFRASRDPRFASRVPLFISHFPPRGSEFSRSAYSFFVLFSLDNSLFSFKKNE